MIGLLDFETQSEIDLRHCGGRNYAEHGSTRILCLVMSIESNLHVWVNGPWPSVFIPRPKLLGDRSFETYVSNTIPDVFLGCDTLVAHNADDFDALVWKEKVSREPRTWVDTIHRARSSGLRGSLDELGQRFLGVGKDEVGKRMLNKVMTLPNKHTLPGNVGLIASYCIQDVIILEYLHEKLQEVGPFDSKTLASHRECNSRGVLFDAALARKIIAWGEEESENAKSEIRKIEPKIVDKLRSPEVIRSWLESEGVTLPDMRKETVEHFINDPDDYSDVEVPPQVFRVLELRKSCLRITGAKLSQALASVSPDGRLRDSFTFHGAHTGRWSGRRVQLQNLPRGVSGLNVRGIIEGSVDYRGEALRLETLRQSTPASPVMASKPITSHDILSTMIRPCFYGHDLLIADYNAIECRGAAWLAGEDKLLEVFRNKGSPYETTATRIFGRTITKKDVVERFIGKETTLGSTYQMSAGKFERYLENKGINLSACGVTGEQCITSFRENYPRLVACWYELNRRAMYVVLTGSIESVAKCRMYMRDGNLHIELPSGRILWYRKARVEKCIAQWGDEIDQVVYEGIRHTTNLFGGKLLENITQAVCRDLLAAAMSRSKFPNVLHAHDELVSEGQDERVHEHGQSMAVVPEWARDFPIGVEYFSCPRYVKEPWSDSVKGNV